MQTLLLVVSVLASAPAVVPAPPTVPVAPFRTFSDGHRTWKLYESAVLVAEPAPSDEVAARLRAIDATATVVLSRPTMRIWKVVDARVVRGRIASLRPAFHDVPTGGGRYRVPMGLVCDGVRRAAEWSDVLSQSGASCLPDFWYPPTLR